MFRNYLKTEDGIISQCENVKMAQFENVNTDV